VPAAVLQQHCRLQWGILQTLFLEMFFSSVLFNVFQTFSRSRGSSGCIVSDYGLDDGVQSPREEEDFSSSLCIQTGSGAHPASCPMGTGGPFSRSKAWLGRDADYSPHLVLSLRMSRSYISSPSGASMACSGTALFFTDFWYVGFEVFTVM
jgi:hypothetical protein